MSICFVLASASALLGQDSSRQGVSGAQGAEDPLLTEARKLSGEGRLSDAAGVYAEWLAENAGHPAFGLILIEAADSQPSVERALELLRVYTPRVQDSQQRELCRASQIDLLEMLGRTEQALGLLRSFPPTPTWLYRQAQLLYQQGLDEEAENSLQKALKALLGDQNGELGINTEQSSEKKIELEARIRLLQARIFVNQDRSREAENLFHLLGEKYGNTALGPGIILAYYEFLLAQGRKEAADEQLETLARKFPDSPELVLARTDGGRADAAEPNGGGEKIDYAPIPSRLLPRDLENLSPAQEGLGPDRGRELPDTQPADRPEKSPAAAPELAKPQPATATEHGTPTLPEVEVQPHSTAAEVKPSAEAKPLVGEKPPSEAKPPSPTALVQTGSFRDQENAEYMVRDLKASGFEAEVVQKQIGGTLYYRVVIGPLMTVEQAQAVLMKLKDASFEGVLLFPE